MGLGTLLRAAIGATFTPQRVSRGQAQAVLERLSAVTHVTGSAEQLANDRERRVGGVNDWNVARQGMPYHSRLMRELTDFVSRPAVTNLAHALRLGAGALLVTPYGSNRVRAGASATCLVVHTLVAPRHHYGADGSDHVAWISQMLSLAGRLSRHDRAVVDATLWLASLQAVMSYAASGWVKLAGEPWRNDEAVPGIMRTRVYGNKHIHRLLIRYPVLNRIIGKATLVLECGYPVIYAVGGRLGRPIMAAGAMMHLSIAATMGLGRFVTAFLSFYGALAYTAQPRELAPGRDDRMSRLVLGGSALTVVGLVLAAEVRRRRILVPDDRDRCLDTRSGATLTYRLDEGSTVATGSDRPLFVLENGLMVPRGFWSWIANDLQAHGDVVTYHRAGYGASTGTGGVGRVRPFSHLVGDLEDLLEHLGEERTGPVVLIGHSLGGYLVHELAAARPDLVDRVVLIDSTHPDELRNSPQQAFAAEGVLDSLRMGRWSLRLGLGPMLEQPRWAYQLSGDTATESMRLYRDARLWATALAEWQALVDSFAHATGTKSIAHPLLVLTARASVAADEAMLDLHRDFAEASPLGRHVVLEQADHESILTSREVSARTSAEIIDFLPSSPADVLVQEAV